MDQLFIEDVGPLVKVSISDWPVSTKFKHWQFSLMFLYGSRFSMLAMIKAFIE